MRANLLGAASSWRGTFDAHVQGNVDTVPQKLLDDPTVDVWLLAPPCQPYTRRGNRRGADDGRAGSFMTLLHRLPTLKAGY